MSTNTYWAFSIYCRLRVLSSLFLRLLIKHFLCVRHYSKHLVDTTNKNKVPNFKELIL